MYGKRQIALASNFALAFDVDCQRVNDYNLLGCHVWKDYASDISEHAEQSLLISLCAHFLDDRGQESLVCLSTQMQPRCTCSILVKVNCEDILEM